MSAVVSAIGDVFEAVGDAVGAVVEGIGDIVPARHGQMQAGDADRLVQCRQPLTLHHHIETAAIRLHLDIVGPDHGLRIDPIGHQPPVIDRRHQPLHLPGERQ